MNLILWRHADAEYQHNDKMRKLTDKGCQQAQISADWLLAHLPIDKYRVYTSEAVRSQQTASYLHQSISIEPLLNPDTVPQNLTTLLLQQIDHGNCIWVGHQPWLGQLCSYLLNGTWLPQQYWSVKKSSFWWFEVSFFHHQPSARLKVVLNPGVLK